VEVLILLALMMISWVLGYLMNSWYRAGIRCERVMVQRLQPGTIILSKSTHLDKKWGLADIRKPDDGLRKKVRVLHYPQ